LGVRLLYQPKSMENFMADFLAEYYAAKKAVDSLPDPEEGAPRLENCSFGQEMYDSFWIKSWAHILN
jgi:hypothetical protein